MDSLEDTPTIKATHSTLCVMPSLPGWDLMFFIQSSDKRSITAASLSLEIKFTKSMLMESKVRSVLRRRDFIRNTTSQMVKRSSSKTIVLSTRNISSLEKKLIGTSTKRADQKTGSITTTLRLWKNLFKTTF
jgi:hypothetical protein